MKTPLGRPLSTTAVVALVALLVACGTAEADDNPRPGVDAQSAPLPAAQAAPQPHPADHEAGKPHADHSAAATVGRQIFVQHCAGCHGQNAEGKVGPALKGTAHTAEEIQKFVAGGVPPKMPPFSGKLQAEQIAAVAAYVKSLGSPMDAEHRHPGREHAPGAMQPGAHQHGAGMAGMGMMSMNRTVGQEMYRLGSGTAWRPGSAPLWAKTAMWGKWMIMQHGNAMVMYDAQGGPRGVSRAVASNWYMAMGMRPLGKGDLMVRTMLSLEPATFGDNGQPQLFQTGEGLVDRQHPHDLFMEIAAQYSHPLSSNLGAYLYLAPIGEPALGPVAFMHRVSAYEIPTAPLIHHWSDATHISYGVATAGLQSKHWKGEVSWFNGHEPDAKRWAIDPLGLNSVSGRLSYAPNPNWVLQFSRGHISKPELNYDPHHGDVKRTTFSVQHNRPLPRGNWASTFVWGRNEGEGRGVGSGTSNGFLLESSYNWADRNYVFGRIERVNKDELLEHTDPRAGRKFMVNALSLGYSRDIGHSKSFETALGAMATVYSKSDALDRIYGDFPVAVQVFLRIRPRRMRGMAAMPAKPAKHDAHPHGSGSPTPLGALLARELAVAAGRLPAPLDVGDGQRGAIHDPGNRRGPGVMRNSQCVSDGCRGPVFTHYAARIMRIGSSARSPHYLLAPIVERTHGQRAETGN